MMVVCESQLGGRGCGAAYNDESHWTLCPHNPLYRDPEDVLCEKHDLFNCQLCLGLPHNPAANYPRLSPEEEELVAETLFFQLRRLRSTLRGLLSAVLHSVCWPLEWFRDRRGSSDSLRNPQESSGDGSMLP